MPDYQDNPQGLPANGIIPGGGQSQDATLPVSKRRFSPPPGRHRSREQNPFLAKMENPGIVGTTGAGMNLSNPVGSEPSVETPEQIATPDVVSALDPAYSMHPLIKALTPGMGQGPTGMPTLLPKGWGSPWQMLGPEFLGKNMTQAQLLSALGYPGMGLDWGIKTQGEAL